MFLFGHLGIGSKLASPWGRGLPKWWLLLGTLLPDLIDKPLYYFFSFITGKNGLELGILSGTQTIGHTALFLLFLTVLALIRRSPALAALGLGAATHLLLDGVVDHFSGAAQHQFILALLFPFMGAHFPVIPASKIAHPFNGVGNSTVLAAEALGLAILAWDYWKWTNISEIRSVFRNRRIERRLRKARRRNQSEQTVS